MIEDLLDDEARWKIQQALALTRTPNKAEIKRFFQERLASNNTEQLGSGFEFNAKAVLQGLRARLGA
jgi:hypothetical protein